MANFLEHHLRRIQRIADWLDDREATQKAKKNSQLYSPLIAEAEKKKDFEERDRLISEGSFERDAALDPVYQRKGERLAAKARRFGIVVPPQPTRYDEESDDWELSRVYGFWLPTTELERRLRREIRDEERASYDEFRKWSTLIFALSGFALGLASLLAKQKQSDPCPRNYYRTDSGECTFAIQKPQATQASPNPAPVPCPTPAPARKPHLKTKGQSK